MTDGAFGHHGFFETVTDVLTGKILGNRFGVTPERDREVGYNGERVETWTEPVTLERGHRSVLVSASVKKPVRVRTILFRVSGTVRWKHPLDP